MKTGKVDAKNELLKASVKIVLVRALKDNFSYEKYMLTFQFSM
jgi:hypothetical protein